MPNETDDLLHIMIGRIKSPKIHVSEPAGVKGNLGFSDYGTKKHPKISPSEGDYDKPREGYLALGTRGPISNERDVTKQVRQRVDDDIDKEGKDIRAIEARRVARRNRPIILGGSK